MLKDACVHDLRPELQLLGALLGLKVGVVLQVTVIKVGILRRSVLCNKQKRYNEREYEIANA